MRKITLASQAFLAYSFLDTPILYLSEVSSETEGGFFFCQRLLLAPFSDIDGMTN